MTCLRCIYYRVGDRVVFQCNNFEHCEMAAKIRNFGTNRNCVTCNKERHAMHHLRKTGHGLQVNADL